ncbi:hypothetical protein F2Q65_18755 [Thiohalocapsa marina]|uniref:Uncharacterized protein n=1 Tax=Thiohalocapsa marina TaxID=424902 RepID=A0A5M8FB10_9GAMM|nr:hypothetical protein F2Q65_18755 [Thiohalocapsa marina]
METLRLFHPTGFGFWLLRALVSGGNAALIPPYGLWPFVSGGNAALIPPYGLWALGFGLWALTSGGNAALIPPYGLWALGFGLLSKRNVTSTKRCGG